ncbi:MAG: hypothetical protein CVU14_06005 [Bacteroidetes bacterium HGW-Bacteroidetes-9]|nr:MAG: hypothetical protein CVU14_06005 [Bacteroidetes bacterium HGW-Bacteroidetes-9]
MALNIKIHKADNRGKADYGWLKARYSFSFANYFDPLRERFGVLRVLNDDIIDGGGGFDTHPHNNMEIITIPLKGALEHRDSMGNSSVIREGEIQYMSAGIGVQHSERNFSDSEPINLLQLWIFPKTKNTKPLYDQINLEGKRIQNSIQTIVSPEGGKDIIKINQDAWLSLLNSDAGLKHKYELHKPDNGLFVFVIEGETVIGANIARHRDSVEIKGVEEITLTINAPSKLLLIEVPED